MNPWRREQERKRQGLPHFRPPVTRGPYVIWGGPAIAAKTFPIRFPATFRTSGEAIAARKALAVALPGYQFTICSLEMSDKIERAQKEGRL